jgi:tetratricopeptide (TPR) repeat protein
MFGSAASPSDKGKSGMSVLRRILIIGVCLTAAILAGGFSQIATSVLAPQGGFQSEELYHASHSMPMTLLGQFRTNLDAYLWLRTIDYLHAGITYRPHTRAEHAKGMHTHTHDIGGFAQHECGGPTLIPPKEQDWRGVFGNLERSLQPYRPGPATHTDPQELIPWYRIQTIINPLDVNAYLTCAFFLADFAKKPENAKEFLIEGIENNPESPALHKALGQLYIEKWKKYDEAIPYLERAVALGKKEVDRDAKQEQTLAEAYYFLASAHKETGKLEEALRISEEGMAECPGNAFVRVINRVIKRDIEEKDGVPVS